MKQTAVEWLEEIINKNGLQMSDYLKFTFEQAKEMEKEQIKNAHNEGYGSGYMDDLKSPEQYYNETYGGNK